MLVVYQEWIVIFPSWIVILLNIDNVIRWDKATRAKYDIYIFPLLTFIFLLNMYYLYILNWHRKKPRAIPVDVGGEPSLAVRISEFQSPLNYEIFPDIANLVNKACNHRDYKDSWHRPFLGTREVILRKVETHPNGTCFEKLDLGSYKWLTYKQVNEAILHFANGLDDLKIQKDQRAAIFSDNRAEFFIAMHGCFRRGIVVVILDPSLGEDALLQLFNETEVTTLICGCKELKKLIKIRGQLESVKCLICMDEDIPFSDSSTLHGWTIIRMTDVRKLGRKWIKFPYVPHPEELAVIMYTSGSTGLPKGVIMTHANIIATTIAIMSIIPRLEINDVHLAYLPMAHIHELVIEHVIAGAGGAIVYGSPLTDGIKKGTKDDDTTLVPTMTAAVPAILDRVCDVVLKEVNAKGGISKKFFDFAYQRRLQAINGSWFGAWGLEKVLWNLLVFRKVRATVGGGRLRFIIASGAPLSPNTQKFINICIGATILQGYGLTETCGSGTFSDFDDITTGRVGLPLPFSYVKLIDWPEGGYSINDSLMPSGEIVIGGTSITLGYFKNEEKTRESYKVDEKGVRWFYTGDIGRFHADGCLEIIDRKNDILKLQHGECVSLGKVEAALLVSSFVDNILVHVDSFYSYCVALVVVSHPALEDWASKQGIIYYDLVELCSKEEAVNEVYASLVKEGEKACLEKFEIPARIKLLANPWTIDSGLVNATLKIKRESIKKAFQEELSELYAS